MDPITEESVRHSVSKDSTDRHKNELINFQDVLDPSQISVLSRDKLIDLVVVLRLMHNSTESVKIMTQNFDPKKAKYELAKLKGSVEISSAGGAEGGADVMNLLLSLMQSMTQQRQDEAKQRLEEITRREKREDDLRMLLEKKESEKQIELHKQELERQFELNRREVEKQLELDKKEVERKVEADKIIADQLLEKERMDKILEQEREARHRKDEALFDFYVYLSKIVLFTDNSPLHYIVSSVPASSKLMRWVLFLSRYDITIIHLAGTLNFTADCLSRCL